MGIFDAIGMTIRLVFGATVFILLILPLSIGSFALSFLLLPVDLIVTILSGGTVKFPIFSGFQSVAKGLLGWFSDFANS